MTPRPAVWKLAALLLVSLAVPARAHARTWVVRPGESIRAALAGAHAGDTIEVLPGTYREGAGDDVVALPIALDGVRLVGRSSPDHPVVLENAGASQPGAQGSPTQQFGIWVSPAGTVPDPRPDPVHPVDPEHPACGLDGTTLRGFSLEGFTIRGFEVHGVHLACVDGFSLKRNVSDANAVYGLFPVRSRDGVIADNEATGTFLDAAIYVGQSDRVLVADNRVHGNLLGIEIENSRQCSVVGNLVWENTFGIFVDILPGLQRSTQRSTLVAFNSVHDNTRANSGDPNDLLGILPAGIGVLLVGADTTTVAWNGVLRNPFAGIAVVNLCLGLSLQLGTCPPLDVDPASDGNRIVHNIVKGNGTAVLPPPDPLAGFTADLVWDGTGQRDCWSANVFETVASPVALPACP